MMTISPEQALALLHPGSLEGVCEQLRNMALDGKQTVTWAQVDDIRIALKFDAPVNAVALQLELQGILEPIRTPPRNTGRHAADGMYNAMTSGVSQWRILPAVLHREPIEKIVTDATKGGGPTADPAPQSNALIDADSTGSLTDAQLTGQRTHHAGQLLAALACLDALYESWIDLDEAAKASPHVPADAVRCSRALRTRFHELESFPLLELAEIIAPAIDEPALKFLNCLRNDAAAIACRPTPQPPIAAFMQRRNVINGLARLFSSWTTASAADSIPPADLETGKAKGDIPAGDGQAETTKGQGSTGTPTDVKPKRKGKNINARMLETLGKNNESYGWSAQQWADALGCRKGTIGETKTWTVTLNGIKARMKVEAELKEDRKKRRSDGD